MIIGLYIGLPSMVGIVLEAGVDDPIVRGDEAVLIATVEVHAVGVEEETKLYEQQIHVDGH